MEKKKTLYYRMLLRRDESLVKHFIWGVFDSFASPCRMLIEVFIRKDFGERYFRLPTVVVVFLFLALWPAIWGFVSSFIREFLAPFGLIAQASGQSPMDPMNPMNRPMPGLEAAIMVYPYVGWYIYLVLFLLVCIWHHRAMKRSPSVFDFAKYSLYSGRIHPAFFEIKIGGKAPSRRTIECWLEPAPFFLAGLVLSQIGQQLGWLLMFSAIVYAISYRRAYNEGDNFVMDKIDQMIVNAELAKTFLDDADESETRYYHFPGRKPIDPAKRRTVLDRMREDEEDVPLAK